MIAIAMSMAYLLSESRAEERFLTISTLGSNMMVGNYYTDNVSTVGVGDKMSWYVNVYNHMGSPEYVSIRLKLLNSTQAIPTATHLPSTEAHLIEFKHILTANSTWIAPLTWTIQKVKEQGDYVVIKSLEINGVNIEDLDVRSLNGNDFRIVMELWRYDTQTNSFEFAWSSGLEERSAWNQIWFNVKKSE
jgi:hypothetical protein